MGRRDGGREVGKGRAPCCEKVGLKRGSWTPAEDMRLVAYITRHGHGNWRALPKQAGLLRCGKSCRLRWINYLRPDIKRGNFTKDEEETLIRLHESLGNKWSKIASHLPGRTDNEIKNVWHTYLKKRLPAPGCDVPASSASDASTSYSKQPPEAVISNNQYPPGGLVGNPITPSLDWTDMFNESLSSPSSTNCTINSTTHKLKYPPHEGRRLKESPSSCSFSSNVITNAVQEEMVAELPPLIVEPDIWSMLFEDQSSFPSLLHGPPPGHQAVEERPGTGERAAAADNSSWIEYLEKELDLWGDSEGPLQPDDHNQQQQSPMGVEAVEQLLLSWQAHGGEPDLEIEPLSH